MVEELRLQGRGIPLLVTERLRLRDWRGNDFPAFAEMAADPEVMRFLGGAVGQDQAWRTMSLFAGHWTLRGYGNWVVERKADGAVLGRAGLWRPEGWPGLEVGWMFARSAWGLGYAAEAAHAAVDWAWANLDTPQLISLIAPDNLRSIRVAERLGMTQLRPYELHGLQLIIYSLDRPDTPRGPQPNAVGS